MYGNLDNDNIKRIQDADIITLENIAVSAYENLKPRQRVFADNYLITNQDKKALINAGYSKQNIYNLSMQLKRNADVCLYISAKQELKLRKMQADNQANVDMIGDSLRYLHSVLTGKDAQGQDIKPDDNKIIAAREILKVLKPDQSTGKNKAFSIKKAENMQNGEETSDNKRIKRVNTGNMDKQDFAGDDDD